MIDNRTEKLDLPLPHIDNDLSDDVVRLREAFEKIDLFAESGTAASATKLATKRKINGVDFDGTADITITAQAAGGIADSATGNAGSATKLATKRKINGVDFDGTADITITAQAAGGIADSATGNAGSATKLATKRKINGIDFDGTADITIQDDTKLPVNGIAASATKLATKRKINGVDFDGTADITIPTSDATKLPLAGGEITGTTESTSITTGALRVNGGVGIAKNLFVGGGIEAAGDVKAFSDARLKTKIQVIDGALGKVQRLRGVTFQMNGINQRRTGVIAQEVLAVLPEAVDTSGDYLSVAYGNLAGLIIEAVKELSVKVDAMKK